MLGNAVIPVCGLLLASALAPPLLVFTVLFLQLPLAALAPLRVASDEILMIMMMVSAEKLYERIIRKPKSQHSKANGMEQNKRFRESLSS